MIVEYLVEYLVNICGDERWREWTVEVCSLHVGGMRTKHLAPMFGLNSRRILTRRLAVRFRCCVGNVDIDLCCFNCSEHRV